MNNRFGLFPQTPTFNNMPPVPPPAVQPMYYPNTNGTAGGTFTLPGGTMFTGSAVGGSATGYVYQAGATHPVGNNGAIYATGTNATPNGEHQVQAGYTLKF